MIHQTLPPGYNIENQQVFTDAISTLIAAVPGLAITMPTLCAAASTLPLTMPT